MEDVHWADEATTDLLRFLGRRMGRLPALLLATCRDDELGDDHPLRVALGDLATQRATRRMRLPPLSRDAVRALVGEREVDAAELYRVTGGTRSKSAKSLRPAGHRFRRPSATRWPRGWPGRALAPGRQWRPPR
jgi:hypothetical protein